MISSKLYIMYKKLRNIMINLYNNHQNKNLKFKMDITGVETSEISPRLIIESGDNIHMVKGQIEGNECKFDIPVLEALTQGELGDVYCEVIISGEQYSKLWEEKFEVVSKTEVKVLESNFSQEEETKTKPVINLTSVVEMEDKPEPKKIEEDKVVEESIETEVENETVEEEEKTINKVEENSEIEESGSEEKIYTETKDNEDEEDEVFSFDKFVENKNNE